MVTSPLTDFRVSAQPMPQTSAHRIAELVRMQKFAQRITSTLDIEELVPRIVDDVATRSAAWKSTCICATLSNLDSC